MVSPTAFRQTCAAPRARFILHYGLRIPELRKVVCSKPKRGLLCHQSKIEFSFPKTLLTCGRQNYRLKVRSKTGSNRILFFQKLSGKSEAHQTLRHRDFAGGMVTRQHNLSLKLSLQTEKWDSLTSSNELEFLRPLIHVRISRDSHAKIMQHFLLKILPRY